MVNNQCRVTSDHIITPSHKTYAEDIYFPHSLSKSLKWHNSFVRAAKNLRNTFETHIQKRNGFSYHNLK